MVSHEYRRFIPTGMPEKWKEMTVANNREVEE